MTLYGGFFDPAEKEKELNNILQQIQKEDFWQDPDKAKVLLKKKTELEKSLQKINNLANLYLEAQTAVELSAENLKEFGKEAFNYLNKLKNELKEEEALLKLGGKFDKNDAILEINSGAGGTEAQDWAEMLLRMYLRWAEKKGFTVEELSRTDGEEAGIKSCSLLVKGEYAYGFLRAEQGVHRLVRISPFDANKRRHTSFASVSVTPYLNEDIEVEIDEKDLKIDTFRASGAGGQHVNKTDSAVRITHLPTGIVVVCQNERSQHSNKATAMKILKAKLYEKAELEREEKIKKLQGEKSKIDFGSQIRSYVLHPYKMIKDLRTNFETSDVESVLDGEIDEFIESYLVWKATLKEKEKVRED